MRAKSWNVEIRKIQLDQSCCCKPKDGSKPSVFSSFSDFCTLRIFTFLLLSFFLFSSCTNKIAFSYLDTAVAWRLDDYFDLSSEQEKQVKKEFLGSTKEIIEKNQKLAREIIEPLKSLETDTSEIMDQSADRAQVDCADFQTRLQKVKQIFENGIEVYKAKALILTESLKKEQIEHFIEATEKKLIEDQKKSKDIASFVNKQVESNLKKVEKFLGSLTKEQKEKITAFVKENPRPIAQQIDQQRKNLNHLKEIKSDFVQSKNYFKAYIADWKSQQSADYVQLQENRLLKQEKFYVDLLCHASTNQKKYLLIEVTTVLDDFIEVFKKK